MFEEPEARRVRREELYDSGSEGEPVEEGQDDLGRRAQLNAQLSSLLNLDFGLDDTPSALEQAEPRRVEEGADAPRDNEAEGEEELEFEFRLFRDEGPAQKVVLQKDQVREPGSGAGGFVIARRPLSYYVAAELGAESLARFRSAAVTAEDIFKDATRPRWGLEQPWKVTHISVSDDSTSASMRPISPTDEKSVKDGSRKRPGKKMRIKVRMREKAKMEKEGAARKQLLEKEEHMKDKKKRLNRLKKLKRREKDREKKAATKLGDGTAAAGSSSRESSPEQGQ